MEAETIAYIAITAAALLLAGVVMLYAVSVAVGAPLAAVKAATAEEEGG
jgi:hypothetical protein